MKIITFEMLKVENHTSSNSIFEFKIDGKLNKNINPISIKTLLELTEVKEKADCEFNVEDSNNANLNCKVNLEQYKNIKNFSFKTSEILTDNNHIYLSKLNEVILINTSEEEEEKEKKEEKKNYTVIIILNIIIGIILISIVELFIYFIKKRTKQKKRIISFFR